MAEDPQGISQVERLLAAAEVLVEQVRQTTDGLASTTGASLAEFDQSIRAITDRLELQFQTTSVDHATAVAESSAATVQRLRAVLEAQAQEVGAALSTSAEQLGRATTLLGERVEGLVADELPAFAAQREAAARALGAVAERLVDRLEVASEVYRAAAQDLTTQLTDDVSATSTQIAEAFAEGRGAIASVVTSSVGAALTQAQQDVADVVVRLSQEQVRTLFAQIEAPLVVAAESMRADLVALSRSAVEGMDGAVRSAARDAADGLVERLSGITAELQAVVRAGTTEMSDQVTSTRLARDELLVSVDGAGERLAAAVAAHVDRLVVAGDAAGRVATVAAESMRELGESSAGAASRVSGEVERLVGDLDVAVSGSASAMAEVMAAVDAVAREVAATSSASSGSAELMAQVADRVASLADDDLVERLSGITAELQAVVRAGTTEMSDQATSTREANDQLSQSVDNAVERLRFDVSSAVDRLNAVAGTVATAMSEGVSQASASIGRAEEIAQGMAGETEERLAAAVTQQVDRLLAAGDSTGRAAVLAAESMRELGESAGDIDRRVAGAAIRIDSVLEDSASAMKSLATETATRLSRDVERLVGDLRHAVSSVEDRTVGAADVARTQILSALDAVTGSVTSNASVMSTVMAAVDEVSRQVAVTSTATTGSAEMMAQVADRVATLTDESAVRLIKAADGLTERLGMTVDAAAAAIGDRTAGDMQTLVTTIAWANRTIQQTVETLTDDLASASRTAATEIKESADEGRRRMEALLDTSEKRLSDEVTSGLRPLTGETDRVAEQQATLATTIARVEALMAQRDAETTRRDEVAARMERTIADAAALLTTRATHLREEQKSAVEESQDVARGLEAGTSRAGELIVQLAAVTDRLEAATVAADTSRQALEQVVTRAEELAADAAARRRRASAVPPPTG